MPHFRRFKEQARKKQTKAKFETKTESEIVTKVTATPSCQIVS
jgi:hypothetical protein